MFTMKITDIAPLPCRSLQLITWFSWLLTIKDPKYFIYENRLFKPIQSWLYCYLSDQSRGMWYMTYSLTNKINLWYTMMNANYIPAYFTFYSKYNTKYIIIITNCIINRWFQFGKWKSFPVASANLAFHFGSQLISISHHEMLHRGHYHCLFVAKGRDDWDWLISWRAWMMNQSLLKYGLLPDRLTSEKNAH